MEIYLIASITAALALYFVVLIRIAFAKIQTLIVIRRINIHDDLFTIVLARPWWCRFMSLPRFAAGQSVAISIPGDNTQRRYSMARWQPRPFHYEFTIKREPHGRFSPRLQGYAQVGAKLNVGNPEGNFVLPKHPHKRRAIFIAGGVGITPLLAMYEHQQRTKSYQDIKIYWQIRHEHEAVYREQLGYATHILVSHPSVGRATRINAQLLQQELGDLADCDFYLCASPRLLQYLQNQLQQCGVSTGAMHIERFNLFGGVSSDETIHYAGKQFRCTGYGSLLQAIEAHDLDIRSDCRAGYCGCCLVQVERGRAEHFTTHEYHVPPGHVLACCALPKSEIWLNQAPNNIPQQKH